MRNFFNQQTALFSDFSQKKVRSTTLFYIHGPSQDKNVIHNICCILVLNLFASDKQKLEKNAGKKPYNFI